MSALKNEIQKIKAILKPYRNILWFLCLFVFIDFLWKLMVEESETGKIFLFGYDIDSLVEPVCLWTANVSHWITYHILGYKDFVRDGILIYFPESVSGIRFKVIWGCTGVQQMVMFAFLIALYFGPVKKKLWFIPLSMLFLNFINVIRIIAIVLITKDGFPDWFISFNEWYNHREWVDTPEMRSTFMLDWFELFHKDVFRWLYYNGIMFLLWLLWEEAFNLPYQRKKKQKNKELS